MSAQKDEVTVNTFSQERFANRGTKMLSTRSPQQIGDPTRVAYLEQQVRSNTGDLRTLKELLVGFRQENARQMDQILTFLKAQDSDLSPSPMVPLDSSGIAWKATASILEDQLNEKRSNEAEEMETLRLNVEELQKENSTQSEQISEVTSDRNKWKHQAELLQQEMSEMSHEFKKKKVHPEPILFPSNETVIHNLLISQIEFYFSDHHLKRDKPLMQKLTEDPTGFIGFEEVCTFPKVRTLGQDREVIKKAVCGSKYLTVQKDENGNVTLVGRQEFNPPRAQEFPFRRTVFIYGIPHKNANEGWIRNQFDCFGTIQKVKFDSGPHSSRRKVGARLLQKDPSRVTRLQIQDQNHTEFKFSKEHPSGKWGVSTQLTQYFCHKCNRLKDYNDGYYKSNTSQSAYLFCIQCAAKKAEENLKFYNNKYRPYAQDNDNVKRLYGIDEHAVNDVNTFSTCLVVYESQRQASKCVYVRSRLGIDGCFATHFHNYTRNKKDICQGIETISSIPNMARQESSHRLVPLNMKPQRTHGARVEKVKHGMGPPRMERVSSAPAHALRFSRNHSNYSS